MKLAAVVAVLLSIPCLFAAEAPPQKLAVVNVSFIFEKYTKVPDVQRRIDEKFKPELDKLQQRYKQLAEQNKEIEKFASDASASSTSAALKEKPSVTSD